MPITYHEMPDGKRLMVKEQGSNTAELSIVELTSRIIKIGILTKSTGELVIFRKRAVHEHHRTKSYGFNAWLLHNSKLIKKIRIYEDNDGYNNEYLIPKERIIQGGTEMDFISERQIFYPINQLEIFYKV